MNGKYSTYSLLLVGLIYISTSLMHFGNKKELKVTTWDALGYYMYLPASIIYKDLKQLSFYPEQEKKYQLQGNANEFYQFQKVTNGNLCGKYFVGVACLQMPFFIISHIYAKNSHFEADGFSSPYQTGIIVAALFYLFLGLLFLRKSLLHFFSDKIVALCLLFLCLASNLIQYASIDVGQSHIYLFFLYCLIIWLSIQWHKTYKRREAFGIGFIIGLATLCRPTEIIMFFIPLLWLVSNRAEWKKKTLKLFREKQIIHCALGFFLIISLQLIYWKFTTDSFIHNVGSKWDFFNPHWHVLFGFEKGWVVYTPITLFFIIGLFFFKDKKIKWSIIIFSLLNIWIIIAWHDWRYGGSYSTRALVQSYPIWAFAFAAFIQYTFQKKWKAIFIVIAIYFCGLNLFQIYQYNNGILHYDNMNFEKYRDIYLNPSAKRF